MTAVYKSFILCKPCIVKAKKSKGKPLPLAS